MANSNVIDIAEYRHKKKLQVLGLTQEEVDEWFYGDDNSHEMKDDHFIEYGEDPLFGSGIDMPHQQDMDEDDDCPF